MIGDLHMLINWLIFGNFEILQIFSFLQSFLTLGYFSFVFSGGMWGGVEEGRLTPQVNFCKLLVMVIF